MRKLLVIITVVLSFILTSCQARNEAIDSNNLNSEEQEVTIQEKEKETETETEIENEEELEKEDEELSNNDKLYDIAKAMYLNGDWDGRETEVFGHSLSISSRTGFILVDHYIVKQEELHIPDDFDYKLFSSNTEYIPGYGTYAVIDDMLVRFTRKQMTIVGILNCEGLHTQDLFEESDHYFDTDPDDVDYDSVNCEFSYSARPYLYYDEDSETLIIVTCDESYEKGYLYTIKDFDSTSDIEYLGIITNYMVSYDSTKDSFYYSDEKNNQWIYTKEGPQLVKFTY